MSTAVQEEVLVVATVLLVQVATPTQPLSLLLATYHAASTTPFFCFNLLVLLALATVPPPPLGVGVVVPAAVGSPVTTSSLLSGGCCRSALVGTRYVATSTVRWSLTRRSRQPLRGRLPLVLLHCSYALRTWSATVQEF